MWNTSSQGHFMKRLHRLPAPKLLGVDLDFSFAVITAKPPMAQPVMNARTVVAVKARAHALRIALGRSRFRVKAKAK
jgi:hypothetical protein